MSTGSTKRLPGPSWTGWVHYETLRALPPGRAGNAPLIRYGIEGTAQMPLLAFPAAVGIAGLRDLRISAGRAELPLDGYPERPPATRTALLRDPSKRRSGIAVRCSGPELTYV
jgi:hypothetical protein